MLYYLRVNDVLITLCVACDSGRPPFKSHHELSPHWLVQPLVGPTPWRVTPKSSVYEPNLMRDQSSEERLPKNVLMVIDLYIRMLGYMDPESHGKYLQSIKL
jgi:hypothetical protein